MNQLAEKIKAQGKKIFLEFGGQGAPYLKELSRLFLEKNELDEFFHTTFLILQKHQQVIASSPLYAEGFDLENWLKDPAQAPAEEYLIRANISIPAIMITQSANFLLLLKNGYPLAELAPLVCGATGHSQGVVAATMASIAASGKDFLEVYEKFLEFQLFLGLRAQQAYPTWQIDEKTASESLLLGDKDPAPMVAVVGYSKQEIESMVNSVNGENNLSDSEKIYTALYNTDDSTVISAPPASLMLLRKKYLQEMKEQKKKFVYLRTTAPFHSPHIASCRAPFLKDLELIDFKYSASDLCFPVYSFSDGKNLQTRTNLAVSLFEEVALKRLFWKRAISPVVENPQAGLILDFGPGKTIQKLTQSYLLNDTPQIYCVSNPKDFRVIFD